MSPVRSGRISFPAFNSWTQFNFKNLHDDELKLLLRLRPDGSTNMLHRVGNSEALSMLDNLQRGTICIEDLEIGMRRSLRKQVTDHDIHLFAEVSTDHNPVHVDEDYAQETIFGRRIAHGMLTASLISAVIGEQLPGHGTVYLAQELRFLAPVHPGDVVLTEVEVREIDYSRRRVSLDCQCAVDDKVVLKGEARVLAPSRKFD